MIHLNSRRNNIQFTIEFEYNQQIPQWMILR